MLPLTEVWVLAYLNTVKSTVLERIQAANHTTGCEKRHARIGLAQLPELLLEFLHLLVNLNLCLGTGFLFNGSADSAAIWYS